MVLAAEHADVSVLSYCVESGVFPSRVLVFGEFQNKQDFPRSHDTGCAENFIVLTCMRMKRHWTGQVSSITNKKMYLFTQHFCYKQEVI